MTKKKDVQNNATLPKESVKRRKFVVAEVRGNPYFDVGESSSDDHQDIYGRLLKRTGVPFNIIFSANGEDYRALSMGLSDVNIEEREIKLYHMSGKYRIGVTREGIDAIKEILPGWKVTGNI